MEDRAGGGNVPVTGRLYCHYYYNRNGDQISQPAFSRLFDDDVRAGNPARLLQFIERKGGRVIQSVCVFPPILHLP